MSCEKPITAFRPATGGPIRFGKAAPLDGRAYITIALPCGTCILCREEQARQWAVRITHEATLHIQNAFITLTYADEHIPEYNSLAYKKDMQRFWKRLRHHHGKLRYYAVGEYGDRTNRPHYHACVFGMAFTTNRTILRTTPTLLWTSPELEEAWGLGHVSVGALTTQTARYTASYVTKKLRSKQQYVRIDEKTGELIPLEQPRAYASKGIASEWLERYGNQVYTHDHVVIEGRPQKPPKYYDRWLEKRSEIAMQMIKEGRIEKEKKRIGQDTHARAEIARARVKTKPKKI